MTKYREPRAPTAESIHVTGWKKIGTLTHSTFWGLTDRRRHTMRTSILSPGSMCHSVIFGKFALEKTFSLDFWVKCNFSKIRIKHVILKFLAKTENSRKIISEDSNSNCGKLVKVAAGNCYSQFPIHNSNESRAVLFLAEDRK